MQHSVGIAVISYRCGIGRLVDARTQGVNETMFVRLDDSSSSAAGTAVCRFVWGITVCPPVTSSCSACLVPVHTMGLFSKCCSLG